MMDKLKMHTPNRADENFRKLCELFPNAVTEALDENGEVVRAIDKDVLMQEIAHKVVDGREQRYQFTWPDKRQTVLSANAPINKTLRPVREDETVPTGADNSGKPYCSSGSVDFDTTENLYIEGDNLEVLKLLQETYLGKVKMIYIDPPYNTGSDSFVYDDDRSMSGDDFSDVSGQYNEDGNMLFDMRPNNETNGRFHTDWLNMLYPRLRIAKDLLTDDGVIFISIDDNEVENLKKVCDEIYGKQNFLTMFCWRTDGNFDNQAKIKICHEYILMYAKHASEFPAPPVIDPNVPKTSKLYKSEIRNTIIKNGPKNPISEVVIPAGFPCDFQEGTIMSKSVEWPKYTENITVFGGVTTHQVIASSGWASKAQLEDYIKSNFKPVVDSKGQFARFVITRTGAIEVVKNRSEQQSHVISILNNLGGSQKASADMGELAPFFDFPKPTVLIKYFLQMNCGKDFICLDFFSGSATTAHSVLQLNAEDGGHRKFIMVQLPEKTDEKSEAYKAGYTNICEIGKERIRRAAKKIAEEHPEAKFDGGFRVLKCDSSNMKPVYYKPDEYEPSLFESLTDNIKEDRTPEDLLFQVMLDLGVLPSSKIVESVVCGKRVFNVAENFLIACFDSDISDEVVTAIAKQNPDYAVFRDSGMASDSVMVNFEQIFKAYSPETVRKVL